MYKYATEYFGKYQVHRAWRASRYIATNLDPKTRS